MLLHKRTQKTEQPIGVIIPSQCVFLSPPRIHPVHTISMARTGNRLFGIADATAFKSPALPPRLKVSLFPPCSWKGLEVLQGRLLPHLHTWFLSHTGFSDICGLLGCHLTPWLCPSSLRQIGINISTQVGRLLPRQRKRTRSGE